MRKSLLPEVDVGLSKGYDYCLVFLVSAFVAELGWFEVDGDVSSFESLNDLPFSLWLVLR